MKAAIVERYGAPEVVKLADLPKPVPAEGEVLIRIRATAVNSGDSRVRALRVPAGLGLVVRFSMGFFRPRQPVLGFDLAGEVEAVGRNVTRFRPGDRVAGTAGGFTFGCHAEYKCLSESGTLVTIPDSLGFEEAVSLFFGGATALYFFNRSGLKPGESVLVNGASGAVGTMAVQIAKQMGAEVTGVTSTRNIELVHSLGADHVIDYTKADFARAGRRYDVIMDNVGNAPYARSKRALKPGGRFLLVIGNLPQMISSGFRKNVISSSMDDKEAVNAAVYRRLLDMAASGVIRPVIDRTYPLERIVEAHAYVETGHKRGSVVVTVGAG